MEVVLDTNAVRCMLQNFRRLGEWNNPLQQEFLKTIVGGYLHLPHVVNENF